VNKEQALVTFEKYKIRRLYDEQKATWYFSVIDVVAALTDSANPRDYWFKMKTRVKTEDGFELPTICRQLKKSLTLRRTGPCGRSPITVAA
jgi:hypothetical protein